MEPREAPRRPGRKRLLCVRGGGCLAGESSQGVSRRALPSFLVSLSWIEPYCVSLGDLLRNRVL